METPKGIEREDLDRMLEFLDELRETSDINMYEATPYLLRQFGELDRNKAKEVLRYWMRTYSERHTAGFNV